MIRMRRNEGMSRTKMTRRRNETGRTTMTRRRDEVIRTMMMGYTGNVTGWNKMVTRKRNRGTRRKQRRESSETII